MATKKKRKVNKALTKITTRARAIRKKQPGMAWKTAIKKAGQEYRQTGTSNKKRDEERHAKAPGKRTVKHGRKKSSYYERRKNRSDVPGKLTGTTQSSHNYVVHQYMATSIRKLGEAERAKETLRERLRSEKDKGNKKMIRSSITWQIKLIRSLKKEIAMQKALIR